MRQSENHDTPQPGPECHLFWLRWTNEQSARRSVEAGPVGASVAKSLFEHAVAYEQTESGDERDGNRYQSMHCTTPIRLLKTSPEQTINVIVRVIRRGRSRNHDDRDALRPDFVKRLLPARIHRIFVRLTKKMSAR